MLKTYKSEKLTAEVYATRPEMGQAAADFAVEAIKKVLLEKEFANVIFAAAPSQNETLEALLKSDLDFTRIHAFHMDEYVGFGRECPQSFGTYLYDHVFGKLPFGEVHYINGAAEDPEAECARYADLLTAYPTDIVFLGIGENAHIAFNDPWIADFNDPKLVKLVPLDEVCRNQQVHDGCFPTLDDVPTHAFSLTVPALVKAKHMFCTVPCATKAEAVYLTATAPITEDVPATAMRNHPHAVMYCDKDSGAKIL
jgi:glucosamine-6-phosphate deaminase